MTAVQIRNTVFASIVIGGGTFILYKMIIPSPDKNPDRKVKSVALQVETAENLREGPGAGSAIGDSPRDRQFAKVIELSKQGYSYEAITKIIGKEQKRRYQALYAQEEYDRKQVLKSQRAAKTSGLTLPTFDTVDVIESAVQAVSFSRPASKT